MRETLRTLEAPGIPFEVRYRARGGTIVHLLADRYAVDLRRGYARIERPRILDPEGGIVVYADYVEARDLKPLQLGDQIVKVRAGGVNAKLTRLRNGQFDIAAYLPERKEPSSKIPFEAIVDRVRVELIDQMGTKPWRQIVTTNQVRVTGLGDDWLATSRVVAQGIGTFPFQIQNVPGLGMQASTVAQNAEVAPILAHFLQTPPLRGTQYADLRVASLRVAGPIRVFLPEGKQASVETRLIAKVRDARFQQYQVDAAQFKGLVSMAGASGVFDASLGANRARFNGNVVWQKGVRIGGLTEVSSPGVESLPAWVRRQVPPKTAYHNARFAGWVSYASAKEYRLSGDLHAADLQYQGESVLGVNARVRYVPGALVANVRQATYGGEPAVGAFTLDTRARTLSGTVAARQVDIGGLAKRFGVTGLTGRANVVASLGGTLANPAVDVDAKGTASYRQGARVYAGNFDVSGGYGGNALELRRGLLQGPFGLLAASGAIGRQGSLGIQVTGRNLNPRIIDPQLTGRANLVARIGGTARDPKATGYLEAYNFTARNYLIPAIATDFLVDRRHAEANGLRATRGTAELAGNASYRFADGGIGGRVRARGLQIADLLGEQFAGSIDVSEATVGGTLDRPLVEASVTGRNVLAQGLKVDAVSTHVSSDGRTARLVDATAKVAGGTLTGTARFNIARRQGTAEVTARGVALSDVVPKLSTAVAVKGNVGGLARVAFSTAGVTSIEASGRLRGVAINETPIGDGPWNVGYDGRTYTGSVQVGSLERYVSLDDLTFNPRSGLATGQVNLFNSQVEDLLAISSRYLPQLSYDTQQALRSTSGTVNLGATFGGSLEAPSLDVQTLEASNLKYNDVALGTLTASVSMEDKKWNLRQLNLSGGVLTAKASGTVDEKGSTNLSGDLGTPALADLGRIVPMLAGQTGNANLSFVATGPTSRPDVRASLDAGGLLRGPTQSEESALRISLLGRLIGADGRLALDGNYYYRGFQGRLEASSPFEYPFKIPADGKAEGLLTVEERDLSEIASFAPGIDPKRTSGKVAGEIRASGSPNNLNLTGGINLKADTIAFLVPKTDPTKAPNTIDETLKNVTLGLTLKNGALAFDAGAEGSRGGRVDANVSTPVIELQRLISTLQNQGMTALMDNPLTGSIKLQGLSLKQAFPNPSQPDEALAGLVGGSVGGVADGTIDVTGTVRTPNLAGRIALSKVDTEIPAIVGGGGQASVPVINPTFDLRLALSDPARIRTTAADLSVLGGGRVTGSLAEPSIRSNLQVETGSIRLPAARVRLEQGGTVTFNYEYAPGGAFATLDVDLEGRTSVTAQRFNDAYERYDITLGVRGDLLKEGGLTLSAQSDPPDLSQERILALLGQTDLISTLATSGFGQSDTERRLRDALAGYALPTLTDPIASKIAQGLGLEYLNIEYNGFEQASLAFAKVLGNGFSIQGRRQIGEPPPGFQALYDIRLVYRPRRLRGVLSRFSFSIGADQDRPFKIALEYGTRF